MWGTHLSREAEVRGRKENKQTKSSWSVYPVEGQKQLKENKQTKSRWSVYPVGGQTQLEENKQTKSRRSVYPVRKGG